MKIGYHLYLRQRVRILQKEFNTVLNYAVVEIEEKKSRFIASVKPVNDEEEAIGFINELKAKYWNATHNVYAYLIVGNNTIQRFSDAGEPSGTAGMPVLEVIKRKNLQNVVVVITRYFGGTLLGVSGLIQAYKQAAGDALSNAIIFTKTVEHLLEIAFEYQAMNSLMQLIKEDQLEIVSSRLDLKCLIRLKVRAARLESVESRINNITGILDCRMVLE